MKSPRRTFFVAFLALALGLSFGTRAHAESPREELVHAYHHLKRADHDYDGHRVAALREVESAARELGLNLEGDGPGEERQWKSDKHLDEARRLLRHAREKLEAHDRDRVAGRVDKAVKEIDIALKIK